MTDASCEWMEERKENGERVRMKQEKKRGDRGEVREKERSVRRQGGQKKKSEMGREKDVFTLSFPHTISLFLTRDRRQRVV